MRISVLSHRIAWKWESTMRHALGIRRRIRPVRPVIAYTPETKWASSVWATLTLTDLYEKVELTA